MNSTEEIWKPIQDFEGYEVSSEGRVRSLDRYVNRNGRGKYIAKGRILKHQKNHKGYLIVRLYDLNHKGKTIPIHRLVWEAFNGRRPEGMQINHIDEDKSNNSIKNLNLMTCKENVNLGTANERRSKSELNRKSHSKPVIQYNLDGVFIAEYPSQAEVERQLGIDQASISYCCTGKGKTSHGFIFKYK